MREATDALVLDLVEWIAREPRPYSEVIETWRTSCPRLTIWEDAVDRGYVARRPTAEGLRVTITEGGENSCASTAAFRDFALICLSMIAAQTRRVCREENSVSTFPDHALRRHVHMPRRFLGGAPALQFRPRAQRPIRLPAEHMPVTRIPASALRPALAVAIGELSRAGEFGRRFGNGVADIGNPVAGVGAEFGGERSHSCCLRYRWRRSCKETPPVRPRDRPLLPGLRQFGRGRRLLVDERQLSSGRKVDVAARLALPPFNRRGAVRPASARAGGSRRSRART